jgi:hypothetical protein
MIDSYPIPGIIVLIVIAVLVIIIKYICEFIDNRYCSETIPPYIPINNYNCVGESDIPKYEDLPPQYEEITT